MRELTYAFRDGIIEGFYHVSLLLFDPIVDCDQIIHSVVSSCWALRRGGRLPGEYLQEHNTKFEEGVSVIQDQQQSSSKSAG